MGLDRNRNTQLSLHIQPLVPGAAVPGAPVSDSDSTQKSAVVSHCPQMLQQTFKGHGLSKARSMPVVGLLVPGPVVAKVEQGQRCMKGMVNECSRWAGFLP